MTPKEKFCLLAGFLKKDLFKDGCDLFNPKTNERAVPKQLVTDIIYALDQCEKQDKMLDILKKKAVSNFYIQWTKSYKDYNEFCDGTDYAELTQEEYDLLKEWLNEK